MLIRDIRNDFEIIDGVKFMAPSLGMGHGTIVIEKYDFSRRARYDCRNFFKINYETRHRYKKRHL